VENENDVFAVGPFPDFRAKNSRQVRGRDVLHRIVFVHNHRHVVGETGRNRGAKKCQNADCETDSHKANLSLPAMSVDPITRSGLRRA
jgi:hypothetical protein